jgi:ATP-binding cassette subfamily B protein
VASRGWVRRLSGYLLVYKRNLLIAFAGAIVGSVAQVIVPLIERQIVDNVIVRHASPLAPWLVALLALGVVTFVGAYFRRYRGGRVALDVQYDLRNAMHEHLQRLDFANLDRMPTGQLVARANSDSTLVQGLLSFLPIMSGNVLMLVLSLAVMLYLSPLLAVVSVLVAPTLLFISYRMRWRVFPATWDGQQREGDVAQIVDEDVNGVRVVKAFGQERRELERVVAATTKLYGSQMRAVRLQSRYQPLLEAIPSLGQVAVLALGGYLALRHEISLGTFLAFSTYLTQMVAPARMLAGILTIGQQARAGIERIFQLLDLQPAISDPAGAIELASLAGEIVFDDVELSYGGGPPVLRGINLRIAPGETMALVGPSGSGKSTMAMTVPRFYDVTGGSVQVDGHDVRDVALASLRRQIGVVFEEGFLFSDTVRANIAYGRPDATTEEIEAAARSSEAHDFIEQLPRGYDTVVGERGLTLSGGQRQRVALARALVSDARILVLDDATSAVDSVVEERIHAALREIMKGRTTLLVAHRRSTLHLADRIAVLDEGRVVEVGTHEELMEKSALYRSLLSGLEREDAEAVGDRIEVLATLRPLATVPSPPQVQTDQSRPAASYRSIGAPSMGPGLMGGGGGWRLNLAPTPELLARVAALRPVRDFPTVDLETESRRDRHFSLRRLLLEHRRSLGLGLALVVVDALASLAGPVLVKQGIDNGVASGSKGVLFAASAIYLVITLADLIDEIGSTFVTGRVAQRIMMSLRIRIWAHLQRLSLDYYEREMAGRIMTRMTTDVDQFESLIENGLLSALVSMVTFVGVGVALLLLNPELGLVTMSVVVPLAFATVVFRRKAARTYDLARDRIAVVNADFQESLSGVRESQAFVHEDLTKQRFRHLGQQYLEARVAAQRLVGTYFPFVAFLADVADAIVLGLGATLIASGRLTTGALIAFVLYIDLFFSPIQQLSQVFDSWQQTRVSVGRITELMALDTLTPEAPEAVSPGRLSGAVRLEGVRFAYPSSFWRPGLVPSQARRGPKDPKLLVSDDAASRPPPQALKGVDLEIGAGETVALVGETGAGKSTVMKLVARFYDPDEGRLLADGRDLRSFDLHDYRSQLGYVPQEAFLFTGTIRDNISYGRPGASDEEVEAAARSVGAHELIVGLPGGYDHELAERGRSLSGGQRQLIALARAELVDPAILLLDEATSNLDLATEARVAAAMQHVSHGRTTIVIAHRLQTAKSADRIAVLDSGMVAEVGTHDELLALGGRYASMWEAFELVGRGAGAGSGAGSRTVA